MDKLFELANNLLSLDDKRLYWSRSSTGTEEGLGNIYWFRAIPKLTRTSQVGIPCKVFEQKGTLSAGGRDWNMGLHWAPPSSKA